MSPSERDDMEQFELLTSDLAEAGRAARVDDSLIGRPSAAFVENLCAELRSELPAGRGAAATLIAGGTAAYRETPSYRPSAGRHPGIGSGGVQRLPLGRIGSVARVGRWVAVGVAASIVVASVLYGRGLFGTGGTSASAADVGGATVARAGIVSALAAGTDLKAGDDIEVGPGGRATILIGGSYLRMAANSGLVIDSLDPNHVAVSQTHGRVYDRVAVPTGGDFTVRTDGVSWTARGTAFDLDRLATASGGERVQVIALLDGVDVDGPGLRASIAEGSMATITLKADGTSDGSLAIAPIPADVLEDGWLVGNAELDAGLGLPLGRLAGLAPATPVGSATPTASISTTQATTASFDAGPSEAPSGSGGLQATANPTPKPSPRPSPAQTGPPIVDLGALGAGDNLDGTVSFIWSPFTGGPFSGYLLEYELTSSGKVPSIDGPRWAALSTLQTSTAVGGIGPGDYQVRVQAVSTLGGVAAVLAQTVVIHVHISTGHPSSSP